LVFFRSSRAADEGCSWSSKYRLLAQDSIPDLEPIKVFHLAYLVPSCTCKARITSNPSSSIARRQGLSPAERYTNHNPDLVLAGPLSDLISSLPYGLSLTNQSRRIRIVSDICFSPPCSHFKDSWSLTRFYCLPCLLGSLASQRKEKKTPGLLASCITSPPL